jgi:hypothetical protein
MKWLHSQLLALMLALANVERNALKQRGGSLSDDIGQEQQVNQNQFILDLMQGRVTQEVKNLRWRMYKILDYLQGKDVTVTTDKDGNVKYEAKDKVYKQKLKKVKIDDTDPYDLELVIDNTSSETMGYTDMLDDKILKQTEDSKSLGSINLSEYTTYVKKEGKVLIKRTTMPRFKLERYLKKVNVRDIDGDTKLLEFYVNKYPDEYDRLQKMFIHDVKKTIENPRTSTLIEIDSISFITYKDTGIADNRYFEFDMLSYDKIVEFDGSYVIKFKAKPTVWAESVIEQFREKELDAKYETIERKENAPDCVNYIDYI